MRSKLVIMNIILLLALIVAIIAFVLHPNKYLSPDHGQVSGQSVYR